MYLQSVQLSNIRSLGDLTWEVPEPKQGWNVIIGDNGAGKSTFLRAIALALVGPSEAAALRQNWDEWLRIGHQNGRIEINANFSDTYDKFTGRGARPQSLWLQASLKFRRSETGVILEGDGFHHDRTFWGTGAGWFSASYGPFRRFTGGDKDQEKLYYARPKLARHLSVFGESVALSECLEWLKLLQFKKLERDPEGDLLDPLLEFINQPGFLPHDTRLASVSSRGVLFRDGNQCEVAIEQLSDGFRSILSMTLELIRQLAATYEATILFSLDAKHIEVPGVVLIDEIDAHLHPAWQRRIGPWLSEHFPKLQFIVTTHSPFICQAAEVGTIYQLARPGSHTSSRMVEGIERDRLLYGSILEAYGTGMFGDGAVRSVASLEKMQRLAELNQKELAQPLTNQEAAERDGLRAILPTAALPED
ncbi:MAG TPA: AAA family ATPase [Kofleriaceae bacterium]|jgi:predicted ATPase|nr:AAA family ATPase [Kofleriaceae bacterium]